MTNLVARIRTWWWWLTVELWFEEELPPLKGTLLAALAARWSNHAPRAVWLEGRSTPGQMLPDLARQVLLIGQTGYGKTTLLWQILRDRLQRQGDLLPVLIDLRAWHGEEPLDFVASRLSPHATPRMTVSLAALLDQGLALLLVDNLDAHPQALDRWGRWLTERREWRWVAAARSHVVPLTEAARTARLLPFSPELGRPPFLRCPLFAQMAQGDGADVRHRAALLAEHVNRLCPDGQALQRSSLAAWSKTSQAVGEWPLALAAQPDMALGPPHWVSSWYQAILAAQALPADPNDGLTSERVQDPNWWPPIALRMALEDDEGCARWVRAILQQDAAEAGWLLACAGVALHGKAHTASELLWEALRAHLDTGPFRAEWSLASALADVASPEVVNWLAARVSAALPLRQAKLYALIGAIGDFYALEQLAAEGLGHENQLVAIGARRTLQHGGTLGALALAPHLDAADPARRELVADVLGQIGVAAVGALIGQLDHPSKIARKQAAQVLGYIGALAVNPLFDALRQGDEVIKQGVVMALAALDDPSAFPYLVKGVSSSEPLIRREAGLALVRIGRLGAAPHVATLLHDPEPIVRAALVRALDPLLSQALVHDLIRLLQDQEPTVRQPAVERLAELGSQAVLPLIEAYQRANWDVRSMASNLIERIGPAAIPPLEDALRDRRRQVRVAATKALQWLPVQRSVAALTIAMRDSHGPIREAAAVALGRLGFRDGLPPLLSALVDRDQAVRQAAAVALGEIGDPAAAKPLIAALQDRNEAVRETVAQALAQIGRRALPALLENLTGGHWYVRQGVIQALTLIKDPRAVPALSEALDDADWQVRQAAAEALGEIGAADAADGLVRLLDDRRDSLRWAAVEALVQIGSSSVPALLRALRSQRWSTRWAASTALAKLGQPAVPALMAALSSDDQDTRWAAESALAQMGDVALPALTAALYRPEARLRQAATEALSQINTPAARSILEEFWMTSWPSD